MMYHLDDSPLSLMVSPSLIASAISIMEAESLDKGVLRMKHKESRATIEKSPSPAKPLAAKENRRLTISNYVPRGVS